MLRSDGLDKLWWWCDAPLLWHFIECDGFAYLYINSKANIKVDLGINGIYVEDGELEIPITSRTPIPISCIYLIQEQLENALCEIYDYFEEEENG